MKPPSASEEGAGLGGFRRLTDHQFVRFLLVGVLNTLFGYGCFALLLSLGLHYSLALLLSTILGVLFNFKSTGALVFGARDNRLIVRFVLTYTVVYACNVGGVRLLNEAGLSPAVGGAVLLLPMAVLAFMLNKKFVFHRS
ncbi:GtrA family protein [Ramlibacter ginsenosidimutans]|uniref:GtrA family protein n=1 Tax=Ramlibacter ginsenosidimutans TaxID=502333 RepID=A0A934WKL3_9BURK|nr:GtrA family protein [Ramlibacter ginsenosidimutans]MBK6004596.1 GtrA family protein [Ramlibacter ginsenosidimutans]